MFLNITVQTKVEIYSKFDENITKSEIFHAKISGNGSQCVIQSQGTTSNDAAGEKVLIKPV